MICVILALFGVTIAVSDSLVENSAGEELLFGDMLMLLAALTVSIYSIFAKPYIVKYGGIYFTSIIMAIGVRSLIFVAQLSGEPIQLPNFSPVNWWIVLYLGIVAHIFNSKIWLID